MIGWTAYTLLALIVGVRQIRGRTVIKQQDRKSVDYRSLPFFSLIVPVKDEEKVVGRILERLLEVDYPRDRCEIIVVDDDSKDKTPGICREFRELSLGRIRYFFRDSSSGKPSALNFGLTLARGEIIGVFDADNVPQADVLLKSAEYFEDGNCVAVQGLLSSLNAEENMLTKLIHYEGIIQYNALLSGKDKLGLFVPFVGTCLFVRRKVLEEIKGWSDGALSEDLELAARLTEKGYRVKHAPDVRSLQENPSSFSQLVRQRVRWYRGCMEVAFNYGRLLRHADKRSLDAEAFFVGPFMMVGVLATFFLGLYSLFSRLI